MELDFVLLCPGALTLLAVFLGWFYLKKSHEYASQDYSEIMKNTSTSQAKDLEHSKEEDEEITEKDLKPYLITPSEIEEATNYNNETIKKDMKEKGINNIQTYYKTSRLHLKELEDQLSREEQALEREAQRKQLEEIFHLMAKQKEKFGVDSYDDVEDQMKLYSSP